MSPQEYGQMPHSNRQTSAKTALGHSRRFRRHPTMSALTPIMTKPETHYDGRNVPIGDISLGSFDHFISKCEQFIRDVETEHFSSLEVN
jgi:hypothetical protein